jgi:PAS domain S-box-containing protein
MARSSTPRITLASRSRAVRERIATHSRFYAPDIGSPSRRLLLGAVLALATLGIYFAVAPALVADQFLVYSMPAVALAAWLGRFVGGLTATGLCALLSAVLAAPLREGFAITRLEDLWATTAFLAAGFLLSLLFEGMHTGQRRALRLVRDRHDLAEELLTERQRLELMFASLPGLVLELRYEPPLWPPAVHFVSHNAWRLTGYPADQWARPGFLWQKLLPPSDSAEFAAGVREAVRRGNDRLRHRWLLDDGTIRIVDTHVTATPSRVGAFHEVRCVSFDVTELETAARAQAESERRFRAVADRAPIMIWIADQEQTILWGNRAWQEFRGPREDSAQVEPWQEGVHAEDRERLRDEITRAFSTGEESRFEFRRRHADGTWHWVLSVAVPRFDPSGQLVDYLGFCLDVSERKQLEIAREELLAETEGARMAAELATRTKDEFLAKVSHELRNPLNGILGWTQVLAAPQTTDEELRHGVQVIDNSARALARMVDDLLDVSRILSGKLRLSLAPTRLGPVVDAACQAIRPAAAAKGIDFECTLPPDLPQVMGDSQRLQQVVWNLLSNAVKFTPAGGHIAVRGAARDGCVELVVADDGSGIAAEFLPQLFAPFRQADGHATRRHQGLGLGLSIAHHLVAQHGGAIVAESPGPGQGTTFAVSLPVASEQERAPATTAPAPPAPQDLDGLSVLVVDDDAVAREVLHAVLSRSGAAVREAASARDALTALLSSPPDVLVSDIEMPEEDGFSLLRRVRGLSQANGGAVPAVALTAYAQESDRRRALSAGFQEHLAKPIDATRLVATIRRLATH